MPVPSRLLIVALVACLAISQTFASTAAANAAATADADSQGALIAWRLSALSMANPTKLHVPAAGGQTQRSLPDLLTDAGLWDTRSLCAATASRSTVVLFQQPGVHAVDLVKSKNHPIVAAVKSAYDVAPAALEVPHFHFASTTTPLASVQSAAACPAGAGAPAVEYVHVPLPSLSLATDADAQLVTKALQQYPHALFVYASTYAVALRAEAAPAAAEAAAASPAVPDLDKLPYIAQYLIFTPGLFMTLSVTLMLVAFLLVGVSWLTSVKAPVGMEGSKIKGKPKTA